MGLIKAGLGAIGGTLADQWKEFIYCDSMPVDVLVTKGRKRTGSRSSNTKGNDNIITNGSGIAVADGQCMMIVEQGKIVEVCAEPGEYKFDASTEPSIFASEDIKTGILNTFQTIGKRFTYGGDTGKDQRVYYFNLKELTDNKFGTPTPIPFRVFDRKIGFDVDVSVRCNGIFSYRIVNPLVFYANVCGNVESMYTRDEIDSQLRAEFISAMQPAFAKISEMGVRPNALPGHTMEIADAMNEILTKKWTETRGLAIVSVAINSVALPPEDAEMLKQAQRSAFYGNVNMAAGRMTEASAEALKSAAENASGAMTGFMGMGMAMQGGGMGTANLFAMGQQQPMQRPVEEEPVQKEPVKTPEPKPSEDSWTCSCGAVNTGRFCMECGSKKPEPKPAEGSWTCSCGAVNTGKFCMECGSKKPEQPEGWTCSCGTVNKGKFCMECGKKKPAEAPLYRCDKCGWEPKDPAHPPKFCPECGDIFDENDIK